MDIEGKIRVAGAYCNKSQAAIARHIGANPQNFNHKLKRNCLKQEELEQIAEAMGAKYRSYFEFPDGTIIE